MILKPAFTLCFLAKLFHYLSSLWALWVSCSIYNRIKMTTSFYSKGQWIAFKESLLTSVVSIREVQAGPLRQRHAIARISWLLSNSCSLTLTQLPLSRTDRLGHAAGIATPLLQANWKTHLPGMDLSQHCKLCVRVCPRIWITVYTEPTPIVCGAKCSSQIWQKIFQKML